MKYLSLSSNRFANLYYDGRFQNIKGKTIYSNEYDRGYSTEIQYRYENKELRFGFPWSANFELGGTRGVPATTL